MAKLKGTAFNLDYAPLCDPMVVRWLIENRCAVDPIGAAGASDWWEKEPDADSETLMAIYIDLDRVIERAERQMSKGERWTLSAVMDGYALREIAGNGDPRKYRVFYVRAVKKICKAAKEEWREWSNAHSRGEHDLD